MECGIHDQFWDGTCKHALWIAKPQAAAGAAPVLPVLKHEPSKRIAFRLARPRGSTSCLSTYTEADDETDLDFLNLSLAAAGYLPRATVDEALALLPESAMAPYVPCTSGDMNDLAKGEERRLDTPRVNYNYHKCDASNYRISP